MVITGCTLDNMSKKMYEKTKNQAKELGKKLPTKINELYNPYNKFLTSSLPQAFEPKKVNRFLLTFPKKTGIPEWYVKELSRPSYPFNTPITLVLYDPVYSLNTENLLSLAKGNDGLTGKRFKLKLEMLDPTGAVVEKWVLKQCYIETIEWSSLNYGSDEPCYIYVTVGYNDLKVKIK